MHVAVVSADRFVGERQGDGFANALLDRGDAVHDLARDQRVAGSHRVAEPDSTGSIPHASASRSIWDSCA